MSLDASDLFTFVALRSPEKIDARAPRWRHVRDDAYHAPDLGSDFGNHSHLLGGPIQASAIGILPVDLFSPDTLSPVGRRVAIDVAAARPRAEIVARVEAMLVAGFTYGNGSPTVSLPPVIKRLPASSSASAAFAHGLYAIQDRPTYTAAQRLHVLPGSIADLPVNLPGWFRKAVAVFSRQGAAAIPVTPPTLARELGLDGPTPLRSLVFSEAGLYHADFAGYKRILFDILYGLYILRRREAVDLDPVMQALSYLQMVECLAVAEHAEEAIAESKWPTRFPKLSGVLGFTYPELLALDLAGPDAAERLAELGLRGPRNAEQWAQWLAAPAVVHPLIARLDVRLAPFNSLKPIGLGDLKVVKQTFRGYRKGEIAHIETVLDGETKKRTHRSLDRAENSFQLSDSTESDASKDSQSTSRFELKSEAEQVLKSDVGINASTTITYKGSPVVEASLTAGLAVNLSRSDTERSSRNFVNEVLSRATSRIQSKVSSQRSQVRLSEVEETSVHKLENSAGNGHVSGMYRWLEKVYEAQVYNYGRRMMFEFILPEPAEFYVEARLAAAAAELELPAYPTQTGTTVPSGPAMPISAPSEIDEARFATLKQDYDLEGFTFPPAEVPDLPAKNLAGELVFRKSVPFDVFQPPSVTEVFSARLEGVPDGYRISRARVSGQARFANLNEGPVDPNVQNSISVAVENQSIYYRRDETSKHWTDMHTLGAPVRGVSTPEMTEHALPAEWRLPVDIRISVTCITCLEHDLSVHFTATRTPTALADWQQQVYDAIARQVAGTGQESGEADLASRLIDYQRKLDQIKATTVNEIIRGRSGAWNDQVVRRELKRQCLAMIAKEFDAEGGDDLLNGPVGIAGVGQRSTDVDFPVFRVTPGSEDQGQVTEASAVFADQDSTPLEFTFPAIDQARARGRMVQFLEQAFEWPQLSYVFYPYFWARMPQWVKLMHREDAGDPFFTDFLQAGSARALLSVRPGYENAVLHFLATREPWAGGPSPVIGDALYLPVYEEVRNRQDDLAGAEPVGEPWEFTLPTALVYLESQRDPLVMAYPIPRN